MDDAPEKDTQLLDRAPWSMLRAWRVRLVSRAGAVWPPGWRLAAARHRAVEAATASGGFVEAGAPGRAPVWQLMLAGLPDSAFVLDRDRIVLAANAAARSLLAIAPGRHIAQINRSPELLAAIDRAMQTGETQTCQTRMPVPVERHLMGLVSFLGQGGAGEPALLLVLRDLTEQERLSRMRADFVANASHELRTPLASLKGFVETLQGAAKDDPAARARFLAIMEEQADRMSRLIDDLLSLSRIEMHEHVPPSATVDLPAIVAAAARALEGMAKERGIKLAIAPTTVAAVVVGDPDELTQVAQNLLQNAIKYGRPGGHIDVTIGDAGPRLALAIADDGIGIAPEHLPRLTERFYRVSAKESRERGGTGLGLAIVKHIVNRHQGELRVASTLGRGSVFTVLLPAAGSGAI